MMIFVTTTYDEQGKAIEAVQYKDNDHLYINQPLPVGYSTETLGINYGKGTFLVMTLWHGRADCVWTCATKAAAAKRHNSLLSQYGNDAVQTIEIQVK